MIPFRSFPSWISQAWPEDEYVRHSYPHWSYLKWHTQVKVWKISKASNIFLCLSLKVCVNPFHANYTRKLPFSMFNKHIWGIALYYCYSLRSATFLFRYYNQNCHVYIVRKSSTLPVINNDKAKIFGSTSFNGKVAYSENNKNLNTLP